MTVDTGASQIEETRVDKPKEPMSGIKAPTSVPPPSSGNV